ncbi:hypothetical protein PIGHUM_00206 [Pigmentiphaga humi]|uniref:DUF502 domain-containing protein n=1 Tax=Pigmentiphaga humi TaxID=2478468 RepID=A0A3P4AXR7_9BURK|nr:DUF502 domain-containing protein [Pigmentiphaga humi]VCU68156.1 hypothetical protein PIGHUM_00206 [Pigmentiphaga humi]
MKSLYKYFFRGLIAILPLVLTLYVLYVIVAWMESLALGVLHPFIGSFYFPGMGLVLAVAAIVAVGMMLSKERVRRLMSYVEWPFTSIPVIKSIYSSLKSFADYFSPANATRESAQQVVILRMPGNEMEVVGLVTRRSTAGLPEGFLPGDRVAVYLPMGYMIGGYTVFVPSSWLTPIDMSVEEAMRSSLIAWMARTEPAPGASVDDTPPAAAPAAPQDQGRA